MRIVLITRPGLRGVERPGLGREDVNQIGPFILPTSNNLMEPPNLKVAFGAQVQSCRLSSFIKAGEVSLQEIRPQRQYGICMR